MTRLSIICLFVVAICCLAFAAPPTESDWSDHISRYAGKFHLHAKDSNTPVFQFNFKWTEPGKVAE